MTKHRALERELIEDDVNVCLVGSVSPEPDLCVGDITIGWREGAGRENWKRPVQHVLCGHL